MLASLAVLCHQRDVLTIARNKAQLAPSLFNDWRPKVIMFDLDGTLIDTMQSFADLAAALMQEHHDMGYNTARKRYLETSGLPFPTQLEMIHPGHRLNKLVGDIFVEGKRAITANAKMTAATANTLGALKKSNIRLVVSSSSEQPFVDEFAQDAVVEFDLALGYSDTGGKGAPHVRLVKNKLAVDNQDILFIGDSLKDGELALKNNLAFVGRSGTFPADRFNEAFPTAPVIDEIADLRSYLL